MRVVSLFTEQEKDEKDQRSKRRNGMMFLNGSSVMEMKMNEKKRKRNKIPSCSGLFCHLKMKGRERKSQECNKGALSFLD